jgi:hypothetical protein
MWSSPDATYSLPRSIYHLSRTQLKNARNRGGSKIPMVQRLYGGSYGHDMVNTLHKENIYGLPISPPLPNPDTNTPWPNPHYMPS